MSEFDAERELEKKERKYNRAFIIRNEISLPLLEAVNLYEDNAFWLFESGESFHGEFDNEYFYFKDQRVDKRLKLPLSCVNLEYEYDGVECE